MKQKKVTRTCGTCILCMRPPWGRAPPALPMLRPSRQGCASLPALARGRLRGGSFGAAAMADSWFSVPREWVRMDQELFERQAVAPLVPMNPELRRLLPY
jgi:hypothetical protein